MADERLDDLAARLLDPSTPAPSVTESAVGRDAAARGRALLLREYGSEKALDAVLRQAGRPRLGDARKGASPTVRGRLPEADFEALKLLEASTGKSQSELVREAVGLLLTEHGLRRAS